MKTLAAAALAALLVAACSQEAPAPTQTTEAAPPATMTPATPETTLAGFVERAAISDMFEVEASRIALEKSQAQNIKNYAQEMVTAHTATTQQLQAALANVPNAPAAPTALDARHQQMIDDLRNASAAEFDARYLDQQTEAHENALNLLRAYADNGDNDAVRAFAAQVAPTVEQHLTRVRELDRGGADETKG